MTVMVDNARVLVPLDSSVVERMEYNYATLRLTIQFETGSVWQYDDVPVDIWNQINNSESIGASFNYLIRGRFVGHKLNLI